MGEGGFEPPKLKATDLQSAPFDRSGILPNTSYYKLNIIACKYGMSSTNGSRYEGYGSSRTRTLDRPVMSRLL